MAFNQGWRIVMETTETDKTFDVEGEEVLALSHHSGGSWNLHLVLPDDSEILLGAFTENFTQALRSPRGTRLRLEGGTMGARVWVGTVDKTAEGRLL